MPGPTYGCWPVTVTLSLSSLPSSQWTECIFAVLSQHPQGPMQNLPQTLLSLLGHLDPHFQLSPLPQVPSRENSAEMDSIPFPITLHLSIIGYPSHLSLCPGLGACHP